MKLSVPYSKDKHCYVSDASLPYKLHSFKGRIIDLSRPVYVYRNLHITGVWYSIRQGGLVVAHAQSMMLDGCRFIVNEKGRQKVLSTGHKNVHAFIVGRLCGSGIGTCLDRKEFNCKVYYNPMICGSFTHDGNPIKSAAMVMIKEKSVTACYLD